MSDATTPVALAIVVSVVITIWTAIVVGRLLLRAGKRQTDLLARQADMATRLTELISDVRAGAAEIAGARHRPWLSVDTNGPALAGGLLQWDFFVENKGAVPAITRGYTIDIRADEKVVFRDGGELIDSVWPGAPATPLRGMRLARDEQGSLRLHADVIVRYSGR
jgi:hypothetical protein